MISIPLKFLEGDNINGLRIVKAAIKKNNEVFIGWRHAHIMIEMRDSGILKYVSQEDQGFVDQHGNFHDRLISMKIAQTSGQVKSKGLILLSEDVWDKDGTPRSGEYFDPMGDK